MRHSTPSIESQLGHSDLDGISLKQRDKTEETINIGPAKKDFPRLRDFPLGPVGESRNLGKTFLAGTVHELEEKETKYGPSELPRRRLNGQKPEMLVWFRSFVTVSCRCLQQNLEESVVCRMSPFVAVCRMSSVVPW